MKQIKGVLFDFNGTLFFDSIMHMEAFRRSFAILGKPSPSADDMIRLFFGRTNETIYKEQVNSNATKEELEYFSELKEREYQNLCLEQPSLMRLVDGADELLTYLDVNGIPYCLATGSPLGNVEFYLNGALELNRYFSFERDNIVYCDGSFEGKPKPDIYEIAAKKLGLSPEECIIFEDGTSGLISAMRANAGGIVAVYEKGLENPLNEEIMVHSVHHDLTEWKNILSDFGLLR